MNHRRKEKLREVIINKISKEQAYSLQAEFTESKIKEAMFSISDNEVPSPDGFTAGFYKKNWEVVGKDVIVVVSYSIVSKKISWIVE